MTLRRRGATAPIIVFSNRADVRTAVEATRAGATEFLKKPTSVTIGMDAPGRILVVVYMWREERLRLISARRATPQERRRYGGVK